MGRSSQLLQSPPLQQEALSNGAVGETSGPLPAGGAVGDSAGEPSARWSCRELPRGEDCSLRMGLDLMTVGRGEFKNPKEKGLLKVKGERVFQQSPASPGGGWKWG